MKHQPPPVIPGQSQYTYTKFIRITKVHSVISRERSPFPARAWINASGTSVGPEIRGCAVLLAVNQRSGWVTGFVSPRASEMPHAVSLESVRVMYASWGVRSDIKWNWNNLRTTCPGDFVALVHGYIILDKVIGERRVRFHTQRC